MELISRLSTLTFNTSNGILPLLLKTNSRGKNRKRTFTCRPTLIHILNEVSKILVRKKFAKLWSNIETITYGGIHHYFETS